MATQPPWFPRNAVPFTESSFDQLLTWLQSTIPSGTSPLLRVGGTPANGYIPIWSSTYNEAQWGPGPSNFLGLTDTPGAWGSAGDMLRVNALTNALEFFTPATGSGDVVGPGSSINGSLPIFSGTSGKLLAQGPELSTGGNGPADDGKVPLFRSEGQLYGSVNSSSLAAVTGESLVNGVGVRGVAGGTGSAIEGMHSGSGVGVTATSNTGYGAEVYSISGAAALHVFNNLSGTNDIAHFHGNYGATIGLLIQYHGGLSWITTAGRDATRTALGLDTAAYQPTGAFDAAGAAATAETNAKAYADGLVVGLFDDRGNYDASTGAYPSTGGSGGGGAILKGDVWTISVAGTLPGGDVDVGDELRALVDTPGVTASNWAVFEHNVSQATEGVRGTAQIAKQVDVEDAVTTIDTKIVTPLKFWQGAAQLLIETIFKDAVQNNVLLTDLLSPTGDISTSDSVIDAFGKLQSSITSLKADAIHGEIITVINGTYTLVLDAKMAATINEISLETTAGTCTVAIQINGTNVTGMSAIAVTTTKGTSAATGANTIATSNKVTLVVSSASGATNLKFSMKMTKSL